ncbi:MAG: hypothetical protein V2I43_14310 [Parvularcula sp.]|jgi:hypothetical protein|nr:hypothetical protein [Parvularcula sp.]
MTVGAFVIFGLAITAAQVSDDALSRCAVMTDDRARLACFDEAVRPLRESALAEAAARDRTEQARADEARLRAAERDLEAARREAEEARNRARAAEAALAAKEAAEESTERQRFGSRFDSKEREEEIKEISGGVESVTFDPYGMVTVTLENGQVWEQLDADSRKLSTFDADRAEDATVERGILGSYRMRLEPLGKSIRVRRVK